MIDKVAVARTVAYTYGLLGSGSLWALPMDGDVGDLCFCALILGTMSLGG